MTTTEEPTTALILDCATSGLSAEKDFILEVCVILVALGTLDAVDTAHYVVQYAHGHRADERLEKAPPFHKALIEECRTAKSQLGSVEGMLLAGGWGQADFLVNRGLWFDLGFLRHHMPTFSQSLPKREIELKEWELLWGARGVAKYEPAPRTFRASDDAIAAYGEFCHFLEGGAS